jgi:hypothetical protein
VLQGRLIDPIQDHQLGAQVELFHLGASQINHLSRGGELTVQYQGEPDVFDPSLGEAGLMDVTVLDHGPAQGHLTHAGNVGHALGPGHGSRRSKIW